MAKIESSIDEKLDLTVLTVTGELEAGEITAFIASYTGQHTSLVLWDMCAADTVNLSPEKIQQGASRVAKIAARNDKTAFVFSRDIDFGVGRMIHAYSSIEELKSTIQIFRNRDEANEWLLSARE